MYWRWESRMKDRECRVGSYRCTIQRLILEPNYTPEHPRVAGRVLIMEAHLLLLLYYFILSYVYGYIFLHVCLCPCACLVSSGARRGCHIPWNWSNRLLSYRVGAGNWSRVLWKSRVKMRFGRHVSTIISFDTIIICDISKCDETFNLEWNVSFLTMKEVSSSDSCNNSVN